MNALWSSIKPTPEGAHDLDAEINSSELIVQIADIVASDSLYTRNPVTADEVKYYLEGLVWLRVNYVTRKLPLSWREYYEVFWVAPALIMVLLKQIGKVKNIDLDITIRPVTALQEPDLEKMQRLSRSMKHLEQFGVPMGSELPRTREGSYDFMTTVVVGNVVMAVNSDVHPVNAFFASLVSAHLTADIFSPRISYGTTARFRNFVDSLIRRPEDAEVGVRVVEVDRGSERSQSGTRSAGRSGPYTPASKGASAPAEAGKADIIKGPLATSVKP